jgi:hypothetical protein
LLAFPAESEGNMSTEPVNYDAVLADLEARKAQLEAAIAAIKMIAAQGGTAGPHSSGPNVGPSAYLGISIADAAKMHLAGVKQKKSTQEIIDALTAGGLPPSKYTTVYNILTRRQKQVGDIVNLKGDWALAEWYPNHRFKAPKEEVEKEEESEASAASF